MINNDLFIYDNNLPKQLSNDDIYFLFDKMKKGDVKARQKIIKHNMRLVLNQVYKHFINIDYDKNELVSIGLVGLAKAVNTFDITKNFKFSTYATRCINNEILMALRKITQNNVISSLENTTYKCKDDSEIPLIEMISSDINIEKEYTDIEVYNAINRIVNDLPDRDREIIKMYFGFFDKRYNQREISIMLNISQRHVSGLIAKAVNRIAIELEKEGLIERNNNIKNYKKRK